MESNNGKTNDSLLMQPEGTASEPPTGHKTRTALELGFAGGLIWGGLYFLLYFLHLSQYGPSVFVGWWWKEKAWWTHLAGIGVWVALSMVFALFYRYVLLRWNNRAVPLIYGAVIWLVLFAFAAPRLGLMKAVGKLDRATLVTSLSFCLLYGLFVGYSLITEYFSSEPEGSSA
jgi:hypothetical protein